MGFCRLPPGFPSTDGALCAAIEAFYHPLGTDPAKNDNAHTPKRSPDYISGAALTPPAHAAPPRRPHAAGSRQATLLPDSPSLSANFASRQPCVE